MKDLETIAEDYKARLGDNTLGIIGSEVRKSGFVHNAKPLLDNDYSSLLTAEYD